MRRRNYNKSQNQINYCNQILRKKPTNQKINHSVICKNSPIDYLRNCMWWVEEYMNGRQSEEQAIKALKAMPTLINLLISEFANPLPKQSNHQNN